MELVFDFGNARGKWFVPRRRVFGDFLHAIAELRESEWNKIVGRGKPPEGIVKINGVPFAIGNAARRHVIKERPKGAARYRDTYYGIGLAYSLAEGIRRNDVAVTLMASHAPIDAQYARNLVAAAKHTWNVECRYGTFEFVVKRVGVFDEPLGGFANYVFNTDGTDRKKNPLKDITTLVLDVGGYTVDVAAIDSGGAIDQMSLNSTRTGILDLLSGFESDLRSNNATLFQDAGDLDIRRVENAILTGEYRMGRMVVDCRAEAEASMNTLVNDVIQVINAAGGIANFDAILVTGGGAALIYDWLVNAMPRIDFILSEPNRDYMMYSNVFGGAKLSAMSRKAMESR